MEAVQGRHDEARAASFDVSGVFQRLRESEARAREEEAESVWGEWSSSVDHWTIRACLVLFFIGVILAFATSPDLAARHVANGADDVEPFDYAWKHFLFGLPAFLALMLFSFLSVRGARRIGALLAIFGLCAVAFVVIFGVDHGKSATRWFSLFGVSIQPSEFLKPGLVVLCGYLLTSLRQGDRMVARYGVGASAGFAALAVALLILQPDYGQSALIIAVWCAMYFAAGGSMRIIGLVSLAVGAVAIAAYRFQPHFAKRIDGFLDPSSVAHGQVAAAERAIMSGGWFGVGAGEGVRKSSLPDAHADFVLAVAAEEFGFGLVLLIIAIFVLVVCRALARIARSDDPFTRVAGVGLALLIGLQAWVHVGVSAQIVPATGMTLPFISYGGSSMVASAMALGLLLALTRQRAAEPHGRS